MEKIEIVREKCLSDRETSIYCLGRLAAIVHSHNNWYTANGRKCNIPLNPPKVTFYNTTLDCWDIKPFMNILMKEVEKLKDEINIENLRQLEYSCDG